MKSNRFSRIGFVSALLLALFSTAPLAQAADYALGFTGSQVVSIPHQAAQDSYPLTVMCWFMVPTNSPGGGALVGNYISGSLNGWQIAIGGGNDLYAWYWRNNATQVGTTDAGVVNDGLWHHAAFVVDSGGGHLYVDGVLKQTVAWTGTPAACTTTTSIFLGIYQGDSLLTGDVDEVSVWNVALSQSQIQTYMHQPLQGTETGLVNYYRMNEGSGTNIYDSTANADTGILNNPPPAWIFSGAQLQAAPQVVTLAATVNSTMVTLNGTVNPQGLNTGSWFRWGLTTGYGNVTATNTFAAGYSISTNTMTLSGLAVGTYHFQIVATNSAGTNYGADQSFTVVVPSMGLTLGTTNLLVAGAGGRGSDIVVADPALGTWTVTANDSWLHSMAGYQSGIGSTNVIFSFDSNPGGARTGSFTIGNQTLMITQAPSNYVVALPFASTIVSGLSFAGSLTLDGAGNIYILDSQKIVEWNKTNNTLTTITQLSGNVNPQDVAVDNEGNVYFCDIISNLVKEWHVANSNLTTLVSTGLDRPVGIAVDPSGNVYIADAFNNALKEWVAVSGNVVTVVSVTDPTGVALDIAGNVYIASGASALKEWQPATSNLVTLATYSQGINSAGHLAVDGSGNVFIVDYQDGVIQEWVAASGSLPLASAYGQIGVGVDGADNLFVSYYRDGTIKELQRAFVDPTAKSEPFTAGNDSLAPVFPNTVVLTGTFAPYTDQPWVTITGLTNGVVSFSFEANTNGAARTANIYLAGAAIPVTQGYVAPSTPGLLEGPTAGADSVILQFNPPQAVPWTASANDPWLHVPAGGLYAGGITNFAFTFDANPGPTRTGTLMLGTTPLSVTQAGVTYVAASATLTALVTNGVSAPANVAVDNSGYVYITDPGNQALDEWVLANNALEPVVYGGLGQPGGVAFDNSYGAVAFSDTTSNIIYEWSQGAGNYLYPWVTSGLNGPCGIALDAGDNIFIADSGNNAVKEFSSYSYSLITLVSGLNHPQGVALDVFGDVYIADTGNNAIKEWFAANGNVVTVVSNGLNHPASVAVDVSGNIFIADTGDNAVKEWVAASGTLVTLAGGLNHPTGVTLDSADDLYIADTGNNAVEELPRAFVDPTIGMEPYAAGSDALPVILPTSVNLLPPFAPVSDQPWLAVTNVSGGVVNFAFTANTGMLSPRTAHFNVLGVPVSVTQTNAPVVASQLSAQLLGNGSFQFTFTNAPGTSFTVLATTNLTLPLADWVNLGTVSNVSPGIYQFTTQPQTNAQEFYQIIWP